MNDMMNNRFNVPPETFISTILFGAKASPAAPIDGTSSLASSRPRLGDEQWCFLSLLQPSTVLPGPLSTQIKQLIWEFAGVRSGSKWQVIEDAKRNLALRHSAPSSGGHASSPKHSTPHSCRRLK